MNGQSRPPLGQRDDDTVGLEFLDDLVEPLEGPEQRVREGRPIGLWRSVDNANDGISEIGSGFDFADDLVSEGTRSEDQNALQERPLAHQAIGERSQPQKNRQDEEKAEGESLSRDVDVGEQPVQRREKHECDAGRLKKSRRELAKARDDPEVVEVVVVERHGAAERDGERLSEHDQRVRPAHPEWVRPEEDCPRDRSKEADSLEES